MATRSAFPNTDPHFSPTVGSHDEDSKGRNESPILRGGPDTALPKNSPVSLDRRRNCVKPKRVRRLLSTDHHSARSSGNA